VLETPPVFEAPPVTAAPPAFGAPLVPTVLTLSEAQAASRSRYANSDTAIVSLFMTTGCMDLLLYIDVISTFHQHVVLACDRDFDA